MLVRALLPLLFTLSAPAAIVALDLAEASHLLARTGFGATPAEVAPLLDLSRQQAVGVLFDGARSAPVALLPAWADEIPPAPPQGRRRTPEEQEALRKVEGERGGELERWWYHEMAATDSPFTERVVLFWHNHFTSSLQKVRFPELMLRQNLLFRRLALGSFATMVHEIARDPAMLLYLDGQTNGKQQPNENFARELLELFTLGEGRYTESDVKEVARAFTGWRVDPQTGSFQIDARRHDDGVKTVLGRTGRWNGDDVIDIVLERREAALFIVEKLWRELISPDPDPTAAARLAELFRSSGYQIRPLMEALLSCDAFWAPANRGTLFRSPVHLLVGTGRLLGLPEAAAAALPRMGRSLGQQVFNPPTVRGWPGGDQWIDSRTLVQRRKFLEGLLAAADPDGGPAVAGAMRADGVAGASVAAGGAAPAGGTRPDACTSRLAGLRIWAEDEADSPAEALVRLLLPLPPASTVPAADFEAALRGVLLDPAYQLQ